MKAKVKGQRRQDWDIHHIRVVIAKIFEDRFINGLSTKNKDWRDKAVNAVLRVIAAQQHVLCPEYIKKGYEYTGQYPLNFNKTISQCRTICEANIMSNMEFQTTRGAEEFVKKGHITEAEMDDMEIPVVVELGNKVFLCFILHIQLIFVHILIVSIKNLNFLST
jgi:hypothetical protein